MAAVTAPNVHPVEVPVGGAKIGKAAADFVVGKPVVIDGAAAVDPRYPCTYKAAVSETQVHGIVLKPAKAGGPVEVMVAGEFEGYTGLAAGTPLSVVSGSIDSTAPGAGIYPQLIAISATRLWVKL